MSGPNGATPFHEYRVRFPDTADGPGSLTEVEVRATVDLGARSTTFELPGRPPVTVDVVTARALHMLLGAAVFTSLHPSGPQLRVEADTGDGWPTDPARDE